MVRTRYSTRGAADRALALQGGGAISATRVHTHAGSRAAAAHLTHLTPNAPLPNAPLPNVPLPNAPLPNAPLPNVPLPKEAAT